MPDIKRTVEEGGQLVFTPSNQEATDWMKANYQTTTLSFNPKQMPDSVSFEEKAEQAGLSIGPIATPKTVQHAGAHH
jgi:hypothetical protein